MKPTLDKIDAAYKGPIVIERAAPALVADAAPRPLAECEACGAGPQECCAEDCPKAAPIREKIRERIRANLGK